MGPVPTPFLGQHGGIAGLPHDPSPTWAHALAAPPAPDHGARWARSGAMVLTGDAGGPPLPIAAPVASIVGRAVAEVGSLPAWDGSVVRSDRDGRLLGARAAVMGLSRAGRRSCGGATRLMRCADGWIAVGLPRPVDVEALPAWVGISPRSAAAAWPDLERRLATMGVAEALARGQLLELAVSRPGEIGPPVAPWRCVPTGGGAAAGARAPLVVDLSALWAGPLCASLLADAGATVVKVEDPARPDPIRWSAPVLFDALNGAKSSVALDFATVDGRARLRSLLDAADIVVTSSRPRAFEALAVDPAEVRHTTWVAITAYGWSGPGANRVGFGDDAAVAGGLVAGGPVEGASAGDGVEGAGAARDMDQGPRFAGDAIADPLTGVLAAVAALRCHLAGGGWFVDAPLSRAAAWMAGLDGGPAVPALRSDGRWVTGDAARTHVAQPGAPRAGRRARPLGADTASFFERLAG